MRKIISTKCILHKSQILIVKVSAFDYYVCVPFIVAKCSKAYQWVFWMKINPLFTQKELFEHSMFLHINTDFLWRANLLFNSLLYVHLWKAKGQNAIFNGSFEIKEHFNKTSFEKKYYIKMLSSSIIYQLFLEQSFFDGQ